MIYTLPKEINSETKISKNLFLFDLIFIGIFMMLSWMFSSCVYSAIRPLYYIVCFLVALYLRTKSNLNPGKRIISSIYLMIIKDRKTYSRF